MGRVALSVVAEIEEVVHKVGQAADRGESDSVLQQPIIEYVTKLHGRMGQDGFSASTIAKGILPELWKRLSELLGIDRQEIRERFYRRYADGSGRTPTSEALIGVRKQLTKQEQSELQARGRKEVVWGDSIYRPLLSTFREWLVDPRGRNDYEDMCRLIYAVTFFTGRRPWSEVVRIGDFLKIDRPRLWDWEVNDADSPEYLTNPNFTSRLFFEYKGEPVDFSDWADGWLRINGSAKPTYKEKVLNKCIPVDFPVLGVDPELVIEGIKRFRALASTKDWYPRDYVVEEGIHKLAIQPRFTRYSEAIERDLIQPLFDATGNTHQLPNRRRPGKFTVYFLRPMYASYAYSVYSEASRECEDSVDSMVGKLFIQYILGHHDPGMSSATDHYTSWKFQN